MLRPLHLIVLESGVGLDVMAICDFLPITSFTPGNIKTATYRFCMMNMAHSKLGCSGTELSLSNKDLKVLSVSLSKWLSL